MNSAQIVDEGAQFRPDFPIKAATTLYKNEVVAIKSGELQPGTSTLFASGGTIEFLGVATQTYENLAASAQRSEPPVLVKRGFYWECELDPADPPTSAELLGNVALSTPKSVKKTVLATDPKFKLHELLSGNRALVWIPFPA